MSENQATVQITEQNARELLAKEALIIKDYQKKLYVLKNALIDEKKKTTSLEQLSSEMKSQIKQLEEEIIHKDEENEIKLDKIKVKKVKMEINANEDMKTVEETDELNKNNIKT